MASTRSSKFFWLTCLVLALGTLALYLPTIGYPFIGFDDDDYVTDNAMVKAGLTWKGIVWAFNGIHVANWHPLTWISLMFDNQLFGLHAGGYHLTNVLFHAANALLLFWFLCYTTNTRWRSAIVSALFAWHPMHVESVAWISERKDVLSTFFWLLTMLAYARYTRNLANADCHRTNDSSSQSSSGAGRSWLYYVLAVIFCAGALLSKPMAVTLPFVLLLLDVWPLRRIESFSFPIPGLRKLLLEKIPFFLLSAGVCVLTYLGQRGQGAVSPVELSSRLANVPVAYMRYISKLFWPVDLSIIYPYVYHWPTIAIIGSSLLLLLLSALAIIFLRQQAWMAVGWFWFLGTLVPAIGLIQVGAQSMADRYTYIPSIGLFIAAVWWLTAFCATRPNGRFMLSLLGGSALVGCALATTLQIGYWKNTERLFIHALMVTTNNYVADNALGKALENAGHYEQALAFYEDAVKIEPRYAVSQFNLGIILITLGKNEEAMPHLVAAAKLAPANADAQFNLGVFFFKKQNWQEAMKCFEHAIKLKPDFAPAQLRMGQTLVHLEQFSEAEKHLREAIRLRPDDKDAKNALETLLADHPDRK